MKKLIAASALAIGLVLVSQQEASAWTKFGFNAGISINYEGGNNNFLWGAFRSGQVPGYPTDVYMGQGAHCAQGGYPYFGGDFAGGYPVYSSTASDQNQTPKASTAQPAPAKQGPTQAVYYPNAQQGNYGYAYPTTGYSAYPNYGYGTGYQVPSYWYGR